MARKSTPAKGVAPALDDRPPTPRDEVRDTRLLKPFLMAVTAHATRSDALRNTPISHQKEGRA